MIKRARLTFGLLIITAAASAILVSAQAEGPPPTFCGDGVVSSPNDDGLFEKCDEGSNTARCTAICGAKMMGWGWGDNIGWVSINDDNCQPQYLDPNVPASACANQPIQYYSQFNANDRLVGWAWSDNIGWICFGEQCDATRICEFTTDPCDPADYGTVIPSGGWTADVVNDGSPNPPVTGWGKAVALGDSGLISLSCQNDTPPCSASNYQVRIGLTDFGGSCSVTRTTACQTAADCPNGESCFIEQRFGLSGWAWNQTQAGPGLGWIEFGTLGYTIPPWLQTKYGDIYAKKGLTGEESPSYNATYRILSGGGIVNFKSARGQGPEWISPEFGPINFPTPETRYSNILGKLDVSSLLCNFGTNNSCINQFGRTVVKITSQADITLPLNGKIYYHDGDLTINDSIEFSNSTDFSSGAGTIIVDGNLTINANSAYDNSDALTRFRNLASVAWIIKGDLYVSPSVSDLAGNFIAIGNGQAVCSQDPEVSVPGCGEIHSCYNSTACKNRLTVSGLMMTRKFFLNREFPLGDQEASIRGSEIIIYDGRLLANTPPGLADFANSLPIWRSETFSR